ncbi:unnamed protein product [Rhizophagus irregularis]|nr:unnamed protein product [Rhizophagus irregularis]
MAVLSKLREVEDLCAKFEKWYRISPTYNHPLHDDPVDGDLSSLPLTVWASNHEADLNVILDLCTSSLQCTNHSRRIWRF